MDILKVMNDHNLSLRRIPDKVSEIGSMSNYDFAMKNKEDNEVIEIIRNFFKNGEDAYRLTRIPENAGRWMCQSINHNISEVEWDIKKTSSCSDS